MALSVALPLVGLETENFNSYSSFGHIIDIAGLSQSQTSPSPSVSSESSGIGSLGSLKSESVNSDSLPSSPQTTEKVSKISHYFVCIRPGLDLSIFIIFRNGECPYYAINVVYITDLWFMKDSATGHMINVFTYLNVSFRCTYDLQFIGVYCNQNVYLLPLASCQNYSASNIRC